MATTVIAQELACVPLGQEEKSIRQKRRPPEHMFIHTVRFWSMVAIAFLHAGERFNRYQPVSITMRALLAQPLKFGTIAFFMISGFLVGDRLPASDALGYLRRRAHRLLPAWMLWYGLEICYRCEKDLVHAGRGEISLHMLLSTLWFNSLLAVIVTPLWFVPNFLIALTCVVLLRRWLNDLRLGAALLTVNLFYGINVYTEWLPSLHTEAIFGFVFYLWLGAWCALRKDEILRWAQSISGWWFALGALLAASGALVETAILGALHCKDGLNSLRFCNQIYSVLIVLLLIRIRRRTWPSFVNVAETTYGIYLIHAIVINVVFAAIASIVYGHGQVYGPVGLVLMWITLGPAIYFLSLQITRTIASSPRWSWAVGATGSNVQSRARSSRVIEGPVEQGLSNA